MTSSNNLTTIQPWMLKSTITDSWYPDSFARETESALTKALQQSFFNNQHQSIPSCFPPKQTDYCSTTASGSASEPETPGSKRRGPNVFVKPTKRKSRANKRSMTTYIQADPASFRQMVQQVTGVKLEGTGQLPVLVKPEAMRQPIINKLQGLLPTLDTSAYLLHHQNNNNTHRIQVSGSSTGFSELPSVTEDGGAGVDFYSFSSFPTLESSF